MTMMNRRGLLRGLIAAPAIVAIDRLMPVKAIAAAAPTLGFDMALTADFTADTYKLSWYEKTAGGVWAKKTRMLDPTEVVRDGTWICMGKTPVFGVQLETGAFA